MPSFLDPMVVAIEHARRAGLAGEVPVGATLFDPAERRVIAAAANASRRLGDPTAHAEMRVIRAAAATRGGRLHGLDLYVTLEPCAMCAAAMSHARIRRLLYGAEDPKGGGVAHGACVFTHATCHHRPEVYGGIQEQACADLLQSFFDKLRKSAPKRFKAA